MSSKARRNVSKSDCLLVVKENFSDFYDPIIVKQGVARELFVCAVSVLSAAQKSTPRIGGNGSHQHEELHLEQRSLAAGPAESLSLPRSSRANRLRS